jgi:quaternary ammonium compound-resistance protein SugE
MLVGASERSSGHKPSFQTVRRSLGATIQKLDGLPLPGFRQPYIPPEPAKGNAMAWIILGIAVVTEIIWALSLKWAAGYGSWHASIVPVTLSFVNMGLLALAMRGLPAGTAYAVWTGLGAVGVIIGGVILFGDKVSPVQAAFMALTVIGVVGTKLFAPA